jgi:hypothetical protein
MVQLQVRDLSLKPVIFRAEKLSVLPSGGHIVYELNWASHCEARISSCQGVSVSVVLAVVLWLRLSICVIGLYVVSISFVLLVELMSFTQAEN